MHKRLPLYAVVFVLVMSLVTALTVLSLDRVVIESNSAQVSGEQWVLDVVLDQLNDKIIGKVNAAEMKTSCPPGYEGTTCVAGNDLFLDAEVITKSCSYNIENQGQLIYTASQKQMQGWPFNDQQECFDQGGWIATKEKGEINGRCIFIDPEAWHALVDFDRYQFESRIELTVDGQTEIGVINNMDSPDVKIGSRAHADWVGNLVSGDLCEDARDKGVVAVMRSSGNALTGESQWNSYQIYHESGIYGDLSQLDQGYLTTQQIVDTYNQKTNAALAAKSFRSSDGSTAYVSGNNAKIDLKKAIQFPELRLRVRADWLGIFIPVGEPEIISVDSSSFTEGTSGSFKVNYRNKGAYEGSFSLSVTCEDNINVVGTVATFNLGPGQSGSRSFALESKKDVTEAQSDTCVATMTERNSQQSVKKSLKVTVNAQTFCTSGQEKCIGEDAYSCSASGQWVRDSGNDDQCVVSCSIDSDCDDGNPDTIDTCESSGALQGSICKHELDPDVARLQCEADGGKFVELEREPPAWKFWADTETRYLCLTPNLSVPGVVLVVVGVFGFIGSFVLLGGMPPALIVSGIITVIGAVLMFLAGVGVI